jgi:hypothetical protein
MKLKYWDNKIVVFNNQKEGIIILKFLKSIGIKTKWTTDESLFSSNSVYNFGDVNCWKIDYDFKKRQIGLSNIKYLNTDDPKFCSGVLKYSDILKILRKNKLKKLNNE